MKIPRLHQEEGQEAINNNQEGIINLPTGSGKTLIQAMAIINEIKTDILPKVYVVLSPRILLSNQLFAEIREELHANKIDAQYLIVHSGNANDVADIEWSSDLPYRQVNNTTSTTVIKDEVNRARRENVALIISATYDSAMRIAEAGILVQTLHCDEAHNLVTNEFSDIPLLFPARRKFYYTATMKYTGGDIGMNNVEVFGNIIYQKTPLDMVLAGEILRPRMHLVNVVNAVGETDIDKDAAAVISAFNAHQGELKVGAKLLIVAKGSEHLNDLASHPDVLALISNNKGLRIFDISSAYKPRINGVEVNRKVFLRTLQGMDDNDQAIIIHVRILAEGIDIPGITGIMPLNNLEKAAFLQTLGRATRLNKQDRIELYSGNLLSDQLDRFIKPYAWVIVPVWDQLGSEIQASVTTMVTELRSYGFEPFQHVTITTSAGSFNEADDDDALNQLDKNGRSYREFFGDVINTIESKETADTISLNLFKVSKMSRQEIIATEVFFS